jgi:hypothetical protein
MVSPQRIITPQSRGTDDVKLFIIDVSLYTSQISLSPPTPLYSPLVFAARPKCILETFLFYYIRRSRNLHLPLKPEQFWGGSP